MATKSNKNYLKDTGVKPITLKEQLFKGNNIEVKFLNVNKKKTLNDVQLGVFIGGELKYTSNKGVFAITTVKFSVLKRKGWRIYCEGVEKDRMIFKNKKDHEKFIGFCTKVRDCVKIQDMFNDLCYSFIRDFDSQTLVEDAN